MKPIITTFLILLTSAAFAQKGEISVTIANDSTGIEESNEFGFGSSDAIVKDGFELFMRTRYSSYTYGNYRYTKPYKEVVLRATGEKVVLKGLSIDYQTCPNATFSSCDEYNRYFKKAKAKQGKEKVLFEIHHSYSYEQAKTVGFRILLQDFVTHKLK